MERQFLNLICLKYINNGKNSLLSVIIIKYTPREVELIYNILVEIK